MGSLAEAQETKAMDCICCQSNNIAHRPLGLYGYYRCLDCGLIFAGESKSDENRINLINCYQKIDPHNKIANSKSSFFKSVIMQLSLEFENKNRSILDIGCGHAYFLELAKLNGWQASGIEIANGVVQRAREKLEDGNIFHGTLKEAHFSDNSFDVITLWDVLAVVENPFQELEECFRIMKAGGRLGIRTRNVAFHRLAYMLYSPLKKVASAVGIKEPYVFNRYCFSSTSAYQLLQRLGYTNIRIANSPLTSGDPYGHLNVQGQVEYAKRLAELISGLAFRMSSGRMVVGPSLLIWARKPGPDSGIYTSFRQAG